MSPPENYVQKVISAYSEMGTAIRKNKPFVLHRPTTEDMFPETDVRIFNFMPTLLDEDEETPPRILCLCHELLRRPTRLYPTLPAEDGWVLRILLRRPPQSPPHLELSFDKDGTGVIKIDDLFLIAFVQGLPDSKFQFMKYQLYAKNLDFGIPIFAATLFLLVLPPCLLLYLPSSPVHYARTSTQIQRRVLRQVCIL
jgi:hypothetical protein